MEMHYSAEQYYPQPVNYNLQPYWTPIWIPNHPPAPMYAEHMFIPASYPVQNELQTVYFGQPPCEPAFYPAADATPNQCGAAHVEPNYCNYFQHSIVMVHYPTMCPPFERPPQPEQMPIPCEIVNYNCAVSFDSDYGMCYNGECIEPCFIQMPSDQCAVGLTKIEEAEPVPCEKVLPLEIYCDEKVLPLDIYCDDATSVNTLDAAQYSLCATIGQSSICIETIHITDNLIAESDLGESASPFI